VLASSSAVEIVFSLLKTTVPVFKSSRALSTKMAWKMLRKLRVFQNGGYTAFR
jgi:hypothetical protein